MSSLKRKSDGPTDAASATKKPKVNASITSFFGAPKIVSSSTSSSTPTKISSSSFSSSPSSSNAATPKFDKEAWVASLDLEKKKYLQLEITTMDPSWLGLLKDELVKPEFIALKKFLESEVRAGKKMFPPREDVYSWSRHTPFNSVKCVIIGQDPYHNVNQAHGLCFSVRPPTPAPPSLKNMYAALKRDYPSFSPPPRKGGLLTPWAERGVLMLNTSLTVRAHEANSHKDKGWERLTQRVIDLVGQRRTRGVVFMAWGAQAQKRVVKVDAKRHLVLKAVHPSPLAQTRGDGFVGCGHFKKANEWLAARYGDDGQIDWDLNPAAPSSSSSSSSSALKNKKEEEKQDETKAEDDVTPIVAVGELKEVGGKTVEKSDLLEKEGEDGTVDVAESK